jgi:hypothetical protein
MFIVTRLDAEDRNVEIVAVASEEARAREGMIANILEMAADDNLDEGYDPKRDDEVLAFGGLMMWTIHVWNT